MRYIIRDTRTGKLEAGADEFEYLFLAESWIQEFAPNEEHLTIEIKE